MKIIVPFILLVIFQWCSAPLRAQIVTYATYAANGEGPLSQYAANINTSATSYTLERNNGAAGITFACTEGMSNSGAAFTYPYFDFYSGPYISCNVYPNPGHSLNVTGFSLGLRSSLYGAEYVRLVYSVDGGNTWLDNGTDVYVYYSSSCISYVTEYAYDLTWSLSTPEVANSNTGIEFRVYGYYAYQASGNLQLHSVRINGTVEQCSSLTIDQSDFSICEGGSALLSASGASSYLWTPSDGLSSATVSNPTASPSSSTVYTLNGCPDATVSVEVNPQPTGPTLAVQIPNTATICRGQQVSATFNSGTGGTGCGDDFTISIDGGNAIPYTPGTAVGTGANNSIVIQGRRGNCANDAGCTGTDYTTLASWMIDTPPVFTATGNNATCNGAGNGTINISVNSGLSPFHYSIDNGISFNYDSSFITGLVANTYTVQVRDSNGCSAVDSAVVIIAQPAPLTAPFISLINNISCDSLNNGILGVTLLPTGGTAPYKYSLNGNNYISDTLFNGLSAGNYIITARDSQGCISGSSDTVTFIAQAPSIVATNNGPLCVGDTMYLSATTISNATYSWTGPNIFSQQNPAKANANLSDSGIYTVMVSTGGCQSAPATTVVMVDPKPVSPFISANDTAICAGDSTQICAPDTFTAYYWNNGATTSCIYANNADNYSLTVTNAHGCSAPSANHINIISYPFPVISISANGDTLIANNGVSFQWYLGSSIISGATSQTYIAQQSGAYSVLITDSNGCNAVSNAVNLTILDIAKEDENITFEIYPNPVNDNLIIVTDNMVINGLQVEIFDVSGRRCIQANVPKAISSSKIEIDVRILTPGFYVLKVHNLVRRFVKQ